jgi:hypothetical protein
MLGVFRPAHAGLRVAPARLGLAALLACVGVTWTAGASDAFATYGTVTIKKVNAGGNPTDAFPFAASSAISASGGFALKGGESYTRTTVHANAGVYDGPAYTVSEPASDRYELEDIDCTVTPRPYSKSKYGSATPSLAQRKVAIKVGVGEKVFCVFTNRRKTGTIVVRKDLVPATDTGRFDLQVDGSTVRAQAGDGDSGSASVATGTHRVGEAGANLGDYVRSTVCTKPNGDVVAEGSGAVDVPVAAYDLITCVVRNVRMAKIVVEKHTAPADTAAAKTAFDFALSPGAASFALTDGGVETRAVEPGRPYTVTEADPHAKGYKLTGVACSSGAGDVATRTATVTPAAGEVVTCSFTNTKLQPAIHVEKSGPATAYSGDTLDFAFDVTNTGEVPLSDVDVRDDRCAPVVGPVSRAGGDDDDVLDPGETWRFTCSMVASHTLGDANPVTNTVTVQAKDADGNKVEDDDRHDTRFLHPAIDIEKGGPATATAGALITYTLDVTNPGDMPFAKDKVEVTDARCDAAPVLDSTNGDASAGSLDPGDRWTYRCTVRTAVGQTSVANVADVKGTDENGRVVSDEDALTTTLSQPETPASPEPEREPEPEPVATPAPAPAPQPAVAPAAAQQIGGTKVTSRAQPGSARLRGPAACPRTGVVTATVTGRQIRRVTFLVDGRPVRTVTKADRDGRWTLRLRTASLRRGAHGVVARVQFTTASRTSTRTLRTTITRCAVRPARPQFTG